MKPVLAAFVMVLLASLLSRAAEPAEGVMVLNEKRVRLGTRGAPEWESFANDPPTARRLDFKLLDGLG
jgi:hypothetical protein